MDERGCDENVDHLFGFGEFVGAQVKEESVAVAG